MWEIFAQITLNIILLFLIINTYKQKHYPKWGIIIYLIVLYGEYNQLHKLLQMPGYHGLKFLSGATMLLMGSLCCMLIKFYRR